MNPVFAFDITCPFAYLASTQLDGVSARTGATFQWAPVLLGGLFQAAGTPQNLPGTLSPAKARHTALDALRYAELYGVPLVWHPRHPVRSLLQMRVLTALSSDGVLTEAGVRAARALYEAHWVRSASTDEPAVLAGVLSGLGLDASALLAAAESDEVKRTLRSNTDAAAARGAFGVPTFFFTGADGGERRIYGQDRLERLERALSGASSGVTWKGESSPAPGARCEFYFDFSSPFAYLGSEQIEAAAEGAELIWRPMLLGGLFRAIGQVDVPLVTFGPSKQRWMMEDLTTAAEELGAPFRWPSRFPMRTLLPLRLVLAAPEAERSALIHRIFRAYWAEDRDIASESVLRELLGEDAAPYFEAAASPEVKAALQASTEAAAAAGVFGAPSAVIDGQVIWGQDRMRLVRRALAKRGA